MRKYNELYKQALMQAIYRNEYDLFTNEEDRFFPYKPFAHYARERQDILSEGIRLMELLANT